MGIEIIVRGDKTLNDLVKELKEKLLNDDYAIGVCEIDDYLLEITLMKRDKLDA